jgi:hypothetical protein
LLQVIAFVTDKFNLVMASINLTISWILLPSCYKIQQLVQTANILVTTLYVLATACQHFATQMNWSIATSNIALNQL